ncbi:hypothetical protein niasHT_013919 [Heterodera trifolii]|uniref:Uncharacterized protein n=1 Tax=Heterodera trifolii TaxID=157864 RepID=A0ABD2L1X2_9BILA
MECLLNAECFSGHYNCTFYDPESIPREKRRNVVPGVILIGFFIIFELLFLPCIAVFVQKNNLRESCFKLMLFLAILSMFNLFSSCLLIGIYAIRGDVFCDRPLFNYIIGMPFFATYTCESILAVILALNRCIAMANHRLAAVLFDGKKLFIWIAFPNGMMVSYVWQPHIGYVEDTEGWVSLFAIIMIIFNMQIRNNVKAMFQKLTHGIGLTSADVQAS